MAALSIPAAASPVYGSGIGADSLGNTIVGGPHRIRVSYRFRATTTAKLKSITVYIVTAPGYGRGDGGKLRITVRPDDGSAQHRPSARVLAARTVHEPREGAGNVYRFPSPPKLKAGSLYHIVFRNVHPASESNYVSLDGLFTYGSNNAVQPARPKLGWAQLTRSRGATWRARRNPGTGTITPILGLRYSNGKTAGMGYMEVWVRTIETISGPRRVREVFTVSRRDRTVSSLSVRVKRVRGSGALHYHLKRPNGTYVASGTIPASKVPLSSSTSSRGSVWARVRLESPVKLREGKKYYLILRTTREDTEYQTFAIREGASYGYPKTSYFGDGMAQVSDGGPWQAFSAWSGPNPEGDLQFAFR